jgi:citrate lyase subunit alpha/citrate CoA-transferase
MGFHDLKIDASSIHKAHAPIVRHIQSGLITSITTSFMDGSVGKYLTENPMNNPIIFKTHGSRAGDIAQGRVKIDVAFLAASASDCMGNCSGKYGKAPFGAFGYGLVDARYADRVVILTDTLMDYPLVDFSIPETQVDYVVPVDSIGDPSGIATGITELTRNPVYLRIAEYAAKAIDASGLLTDGFSFQTGGSGIALSVAAYVKEIMLKNHVKGSFGMGGITGMMVDLLETGCLRTLIDVQDFDIRATRSLRDHPNHLEVDAVQYAYMPAKSCAGETAGCRHTGRDSNRRVLQRKSAHRLLRENHRRLRRTQRHRGWLQMGIITAPLIRGAFRLWWSM